MWRLTSVIIFLMFINSASFACTTPPSYLADEELIYSTGVRDLIQDSQAIISGRFLENASTGNLSFTVLKSFKSTGIIKEDTVVDVSFSNVRHHFFEPGEDDAPNSGASILKFQIEYGGRVGGGWGGPLSGVFHMSDCERSISIYNNQNYLLFLDSNNIVRARFPLRDEIIALIPAIGRKIISLPQQHQYQ